MQATSQRTPGQGLVPEPAHEAQKVERTGQGASQRPGRLAAAFLRQWQRLVQSWVVRQPTFVNNFVIGRPSTVTESSSASSATSAAHRTQRASDTEL